MASVSDDRIKERHLKHIGEISAAASPPKFKKLTEDEQDFLDRKGRYAPTNNQSIPSEVLGARCYGCGARFRFPMIHSYVDFHEWALTRPQCPDCKSQAQSIWLPIHIRGDKK